MTKLGGKRKEEVSTCFEKHVYSPRHCDVKTWDAILKLHGKAVELGGLQARHSVRGSMVRYDPQVFAEPQRDAVLNTPSPPTEKRTGARCFNPKRGTWHRV